VLFPNSLNSSNTQPIKKSLFTDTFNASMSEAKKIKDDRIQRQKDLEEKTADNVREKLLLDQLSTHLDSKASRLEFMQLSKKIISNFQLSTHLFKKLVCDSLFNGFRIV
jgi:hypothetical protein